jgi:hypothetical protein
MKKSLGIILAATVGSFIASNVIAGASASNAQSADANVKCMGANACKGQSACKTATNACKGMNSCKGTGMIMAASESDCTSKGGTVMKDDASAAPAASSSPTSSSTTSDQD